MSANDRSFLLTILEAGTESNAHGFGMDGYRSPVAVMIISPATLPESVKIQVAGPAGNYATLQSGGTDIVLPAGKATQIIISVAFDMRLVAGGAVAANRTFEVIWNVIAERS